MAIIRNKSREKYTVIDNNIFRKKELSLKATGMLCILLSLPDNWQFSEVGLEAIINESRTSVRTCLKELELKNYLQRERVRTSKGILLNTIYNIYETPMLQNDTLANQPMLQKPTLEKPTLENDTQLNTNRVNTNKRSNNIYSLVIDFLNEKVNTNYRATSSKTKTLINARLNEKFTLEDFKTVISKKCDEWKGGEMEKFLRPETLFGTKFEGYLNAKIVKNSKRPKMMEHGYEKGINYTVDETGQIEI